MWQIVTGRLRLYFLQKRVYALAMTDNSQIEKFREKARELECDESEEAFADKLVNLAKKPADKNDSNSS